jgi:hypothetical protein
MSKSQIVISGCCVCLNHNIIVPKLRFWKAEQTFGNVFSTHFSNERSQKRVLTYVKSALKIRSRRVWLSRRRVVDCNDDASGSDGGIVVRMSSCASIPIIRAMHVEPTLYKWFIATNRRLYHDSRLRIDMTGRDEICAPQKKILEGRTKLTRC